MHSLLHRLDYTWFLKDLNCNLYEHNENERETDRRVLIILQNIYSQKMRHHNKDDAFMNNRIKCTQFVLIHQSL